MVCDIKKTFLLFKCMSWFYSDLGKYIFCKPLLMAGGGHSQKA